MNGTVTTTSLHDDEFVLVSIPRQAYPLVIQTLNNVLATELNSARPSEGALSHSPNAETSDFRGWTRAAVEGLKRDTNIASLIALFDLAAQKQDGDPVSITDIERATGKTWQQIRGDLQRIGSYARKALDENTWQTWPFWTDTGSDRRAIYRVPAVVQQWWRET